MTDRPPRMQDAVLIESLNRATSLQLYQLAALLERLVTDPRRIVAIRKDLHLGQIVRSTTPGATPCAQAGWWKCATLS